MQTTELLAFLRSNVVSKNFYQDTFNCLKEIIGKVVVKETVEGVTAGVIVEAEAYVGSIDKACHAYNDRRTKRTEVMYEKPGTTYIYSVHTHQLLNVVTESEGIADAILIRAVEPILGIELMKERRGSKVAEKNLTNGPGKLCAAMGIENKDYGWDLTKGINLWIAENPHTPNRNVCASRRIGIEYAEDFRDVPWRFFDPDSKYVSKRLKEEFTVL